MDALFTNPVVKSFLAGSLSGTCSTILLQPLDLIKTRIQQAQAQGHAMTSQGQVLTTQGHTLTSQGHTLTLTDKMPMRPTIYSTMRVVIATENVAGLWKGMTPSITRTVPGVGLYFASLHWLKTSFGGNTEKPGPLHAICLGMTARSVAGCAMIPITVLKTRFESGQYNYSNMSTAIVEIYSREGIRGLCCGLVPTLVRDAPYSGLYLMFYTQLKQNAPTLIKGINPSFDMKTNGYLASIAHFYCGIAAGFLASLVTHPADIVKTRMQLEPRIYPSVAKACKQILVLNGPKGFLIGLAPRMLRRTLMSALAWTVYEEIMRRLGLK